jgi:hypothetical protein
MTLGETIGIITAAIVMLTPILYYLINTIASYITSKIKASEGISQNTERIGFLRKMVEDMEEDKVGIEHCSDVHQRVDNDLKELKAITNITQITVARLETKLEGYFNGVR